MTSELALEMYDEILTSSGPGPTLDTFASASWACLRCLKWEKALALVAELEGSGLLDKGNELVVDLRTHCIAIATCRRCLKWDEAKLVYKKLQQIVAREKFYRGKIDISSVSSLGKGSLAALGLLQHMQEEGLVPDGSSYTTCISACDLEGSFDRAVFLWEKMDSISNSYTPGASATTEEENPRAVLSSVIQAVQNASLLWLGDFFYEEGYRRGIFDHWSAKHKGLVDLHNLTISTAKAAVRHAYLDILGRPGKYLYYWLPLP